MSAHICMYTPTLTCVYRDVWMDVDIGKKGGREGVGETKGWKDEWSDGCIDTDMCVTI